MTQTKIGVGMIDASSIGDAKVLQGDGSWVTPSSAPAWVVVSTTSVSAVASVTIAVDNTYDKYEVHISNLLCVTDNAEIYMRVGDSGGIDSGSTDYNHGIAGINVDSHVAANEAQMALQNYYNIGGTFNAVEEGASACVAFDYPTGSRYFNCFGYVCQSNDAGSIHSCIFAGDREATITLTQIQFLMSSGNITSGRFTLIGLKHA